jgi:hypothetical protein
MARDEEEQGGGPIPSAISNIMRPSFPGFRNIWRRFGGRKPPRHDPTKARVWFQPRYRIVRWDGEADLHTTEPCAPQHCSNPDGIGNHSETREGGFDWCGVYFPGLVEAKENQAFLLWYEEGIFEGEQTQPGKDVVAKGKMVLRPALYGAQEEPPLPRFNFFLHEHTDEAAGD